MTTSTTMSLRLLAKETGVSHSFLSQVKHGKRPMPDTLKDKLNALNAYHLLTTPSIPDTEIAIAPALQAGGQEFESPHLHQFLDTNLGYFSS